MKKSLFCDNRELEDIQQFERVLTKPEKHPGNPLFVADQPWENGNMQLYGSVLKTPEKPFPDNPFIPHGAPGSWEQGNLQSASRPVQLPQSCSPLHSSIPMVICT